MLEQTLKKTHTQTASHPPTPQPFGQIGAPYAPHRSQQRVTSPPSPGHLIATKQVGAPIPDNADRGRTGCRRSPAAAGWQSARWVSPSNVCLAPRPHISGPLASTAEALHQVTTGQPAKTPGVRHTPSSSESRSPHPSSWKTLRANTGLPTCPVSVLPKERALSRRSPGRPCQLRRLCQKRPETRHLSVYTSHQDKCGAVEGRRNTPPQEQ